MLNFEAERLGHAIETASMGLPEDWQISLTIENGCAIVTLIDPDGEDVPDEEYCSPDDSLVSQIENAIAHALTNDVEYE